jgi:lactate permease
MTVLSLVPIVAILLCLIVFKFSVTKSGVIGLVIALVVAIGFFGITTSGLAVATGKSLWLALFVSLVVWCALLLYHLVSDFGAIKVINHNLEVALKDKFVAFLLLAWVFAQLLQGIAGLGIPSVIVAPILIALGFNPVKSLAATLVGHSGGVTFGSMGMAFSVTSNLTGISEPELAFSMWAFNAVTYLLTGIGVCFIYGMGDTPPQNPKSPQRETRFGFLKTGFNGIAKGLPYVLPTGIVVIATQYLLLYLGIFTLGTIGPAGAGVAFMFLLYKLRSRKAVAETEQEDSAVSTGSIAKSKLSLLQSVFPYALILVLMLAAQFIPQSVRNDVALTVSFPQTQTVTDAPFASLDEPHVVPAVASFSPIRLFVHPPLVLLIAAVAACMLYKKAGVWDSDKFKGAVKMTVKKGIPSTLALLAFGTASLVMTESGMMNRLAYSVADLTGNLFPFVSPFIGVLATFLTGNNTNSIIMFGIFQREAAITLGLEPAVMSSAQAIAGGLGCAVSSTFILMVALVTNQTDKISDILKKTIPPVLIIAGVMGILNYVLINNYRPWF